MLDSRSDNLTVLDEAAQPLLTPTDAPWFSGVAPWTCNVPEVAFLQGAHALDSPDNDSEQLFRIYLGGADAVVGSAVVRVR